MAKNPIESRSIDSSGVVAIANLQRVFYTHSYGPPDLLFDSLLIGARESYEATSRGKSDPREENEAAVGLAAGVFMAGTLLCDDHFVPARVSNPSENMYTLDFVEGTLHVTTQIYAEDGSATSYFAVSVGGKILEKTFLVRNAVTERVFAHISEDEIRKPHFFTQDLPFICKNTQFDPGLISSTGESALLDQSIELRLAVQVNGHLRDVCVRKEKGEGNGVSCSGAIGDKVRRITRTCPLASRCLWRIPVRPAGKMIRPANIVEDSVQNDVDRESPFSPKCGIAFQPLPRTTG